MNTFVNKEGQSVPQVTFRYRDATSWQSTDSNTLFKGRNVVVFSLPGAFTPTCSSTHVPRFNTLAATFKAQGIDEIMCMSVNDPFVMEAWARDQEAPNIRFLPDGNGEFTKAMGLLVDKSDLNFGSRSWRYAMLVRDGVIEKMFIEPQEAGDPFKVSDADTMLAYINAHAHKPHDVVLFTREGCGFCADVKDALAHAKIPYVNMSLPNATRLTVLQAVVGAQTVPQLFVNGQLIGDSVHALGWILSQSKKEA